MNFDDAKTIVFNCGQEVKRFIYKNSSNFVCCISHNLTFFVLCGALIMMNQYRAVSSNDITSGSLYIVVGVYSAGYPSQKPSDLAVRKISDNLLQDFQSIENTTEPRVNPRQTWRHGDLFFITTDCYTCNIAPEILISRT